MEKDSKVIEYVLGVLTILGVVLTIGVCIAFSAFCAGLGWRFALGC